jgi:hypothetical protein
MILAIHLHAVQMRNAQTESALVFPNIRVTLIMLVDQSV